MKDGDWRVFVLDTIEAMDKGCHQIVRVHLMEQAFGVSFGFVEQRIYKTATALDDDVKFYMFCGAAGIGTDRENYPPIPSLRHGMDTIEWLWAEHKRKEKP